VLGQYIYYSTLIHLRRCATCDLIWADAHLPADVLAQHFEAAYKDREYFDIGRARIFGHLAAEIDRVTPPSGTVLDIGGAQGDLMHRLRERRPDVAAVVNDLSEGATRYAAEHYGLETVTGDFRAVHARGARYDVVVLSDVLYYEPRLAEFWGVLADLLSPGGAVVIRVPNKLALIRAHQALGRLRGARPEVQDKLTFFNPEHLYILDRRYLTSRLRRLGFDQVEVRASPPLVASRSPVQRALAGALFRSADAIARLSAGGLVLTPSMLVVATRRASG
jgi:SAM-dependent methyltransferase